MSAQTPYRDTLVVHFCGDLLQRTMDATTAAAHQQALHGFLEELSPWVLPHELPTLLGPALPLFDACEFPPTADGTAEAVTVALSPQGEVLFRAWLRRRGLDPFRSSS